MKIDSLSKKQLDVFGFILSPKSTLICDGAVRSGKTTAMLDAFVIWAMAHFQNTSFALCGKTVQSAERNLLKPLILSRELPYSFQYKKSEKALLVRCGDIENTFYIFGGKDESSYMLIQGLTLGGVMFDEVALMPKSFVEQAIARTLSMDNPKLWFNCNPDAPTHWFYIEWVKPELQGVKHLHFTMHDNPAMTPEKIAEAERKFTGVFHDRYIKGLWVRAEGLIYRQFAENKAQYVKMLNKDHLHDVMYVSIGIDFGGSRSLTTFVATALHNSFKRVTVVADYNIKAPKGEIDADRVCREFLAFVERLRTRFPWLYIKYTWADNEAQYLINSLRKAARRAGLGMEVLDCKKKRIKDRIFAGNTLLNTNRLLIGDDCTLVQGGLENAVWDSKKPDERLDNFSTDIDILDAFEYSWEPFISRLCPDM